MLRYHTPRRMMGGQSGNITPASMMATMAAPPRYVVHWLPS
jgi:hypothetical protein